MSKILILANDFTTVYNFRLELIIRLIEYGHSVLISLPQNEKNSCFIKMGCRVSDAQISRFGKNPLGEFKTYNYYKRLIKTENPDVILTYTAKPNIYGSLAAGRAGIPCICNVTGLGVNIQRENIIGKIMMQLQKIAYRKASCVFFQNEQNMQLFLQKKIAGKNAKLLPGSGVNLDENPAEPYPESETPVKFLIISRIRKDKGYDELFGAINYFNDVSPHMEFHIAGWYEDDKYKKIVDEYKNSNVIFHGNVPHENIHELIRECHCLIHPSYHEGMSNAILEAAAAARPCLASDINGCKEAIDIKVTGFLFKVSDVDSLILSIKEFISLSYDEKREMGIAGRKKMEREFDRNIVIDKYVEEIDAAAVKYKDCPDLTDN